MSAPDTSAAVSRGRPVTETVEEYRAANPGSLEAEEYAMTHKVRNQRLARRAFLKGWEAALTSPAPLEAGGDAEPDAEVEGPAWLAELARIADEKARTELAVLADAAFWDKTFGMKAGQPSVKAMRHAVDTIIAEAQRLASKPTPSGDAKLARLREIEARAKEMGERYKFASSPEPLLVHYILTGERE